MYEVDLVLCLPLLIGENKILDILGYYSMSASHNWSDGADVNRCRILESKSPGSRVLLFSLPVATETNVLFPGQ